MKDFIARLFIWWHGATLGTLLHTRRRGKFVGTDEFGNSYYQQKNGGPRRWVIYKGEADASKIPPGWYGWMHKRTDVPPTEEQYQARSWEQPHIANRTGTAEAYRPDGSLLSKGTRPKVTGDYDAWSPE